MKLFRKPAVESKALISPELQAILNSSDYLSGYDDPTTFDSFRHSYAHIYRTQSNVAAVVHWKQSNVSQIPFKVLRSVNGVEQPQPDHPVQKLLNFPNPTTSRSRLMSQIQGSKDVYGHAFVWKLRDPNGTVSSLLHVPMSKIEIKSGNIFEPLVFKIQGDSGAKLIAAEDVIWFTSWSPTSNARGVSVLEGLRYVLDEMEAQSKDRKAFWRRGARNSLWFKQDPAAPRVDKDSKERFIEKLRSENTGTGSNVRGMGLLPTGIEPVQIGVSAEDSQLLGSRQFSREEVCLAFGISPEVLGVRPSNFASADQQHQAVWADVMSPVLLDLQEQLEIGLLYADFEDIDSGYHIEANIDAKLYGSPLERMQLGTTVTGGPWMSINTWLKINNLPPDGDPNDPDNPSNQIATPLNTVRGNPSNPDVLPSPNDAPNQFSPDGNAPKAAIVETKAFPTSVMETAQQQHEAVLSHFFERMKRSVKTPSLDEKRWTKELYADLRPLASSTVDTAARSAARNWKDRWDPTMVDHYLDAATQGTSEGIVASAHSTIKDAPSLDEAFTGILAVTVPNLAYDRAHALSIFAFLEAAKQNGKSRKTWQVNSANSRHPERNGVTISSFAEWPWGDAWEPGCQCTISVS